MKQAIVLMIVLSLLVSTLPIGAYAEGSGNISVEYLADGGYIITEITDSMARVAQSKTKNMAKTSYDIDGNLEWRIVLTATFTYDEVTARCTSTDLDVTIYDSSWYEISAYHSREAAQGYANVQLGRKVLGVTVERPTYYLSLTCTPDGNIS